jgi:hypothetical protein
MLFESDYCWDAKLKGSPEEVEAWAQSAIADGWTVATTSDKTNWDGNRIKHYGLYRFVVLPPGVCPGELPTRLGYVLGWDQQLEVPAGHACLQLDATSYRYAPTDRPSTDWGQISCHFVYSPGNGDPSRYCAHIWLPIEYRWAQLLTGLETRNEWERDIRAGAKARADESARLAADWKQLALAAKAKADPRKPPEQFLPYVIAACHFWSHAGGVAGINESARYRISFSGLTGRSFAPETDSVTAEQIAALPVPAPLTEQELAAISTPVYECFECGATYADPSRIDDGGMGCVRCNG